MTEKHSHRSVAGTVTSPAGPAAGITVTAVHRTVSGDTPLKTATTDPSGRYSLAYSMELPSDRVNLVVRAAGEDATIESAVLFGAGVAEQVDLTLPQPPGSEFDRLGARVAPMLDGLDLSDAPLAFVAAGAQAELGEVERLAAAERLAASTGLPAAPFFGLLGQGLPARAAALAQQPAAALREALAAASAAGTVPHLDADQVDDFVTRLRDEHVDAVVDADDDPLLEIFAAAIPDRDDRRHWYEAYLDHRGNADEFWTEHGDEPDADRLRLALRLASLTAQRPPLVRLLLDRFDDGTYTKMGDLADLSVQDWRDLTVEAGGKDDERYARTTAAILADAYPARVFARRLGDSPVADFLRANPDFDLRTSQVGADEPAEIQRDVGDLQRLFRVAPDADAVQVLRDAGLGSSRAIARTGRTAFVRAHGPVLGEARARQVFERAQRTHTEALTVHGELHSYNSLPVPWLPAPVQAAAVADRIPNWERLFGAADFCACSSCRTVYSPAAYLADQLSWLGERRARDGRPVSAVLYERRDDLRDIKLTCDNTNIQLPYADLAAELLESLIAPATAVPPAERQTCGPTPELRAQPQHINPGAYDVLRGAVYPWLLPFDLWTVQVRAFLGHLGVDRAGLMAAFGVADDNERLGLSLTRRKIIAGEALQPARTLAEFYGRPAATTDAALVAEMRRVRALLDAGRLTYAGLAELFRMRFLNACALLTIETEDEEHPCDTTEMVVPALNAAVLERLHRFVRLQRDLGRPAADLDRTIAVLTPGRIDKGTIHALAGLRQLMDRLGVGLDVILGFYAPLDTYAGYGDLSRYDRLFLDPSVVTPVPGTPSPFALHEPDRTELEVVGDLGDPATSASVLAVLGVTDAELAALRAALAPGGAADLANLSALVRTVDLARALDLPVSDLLRLMALSGLTPFPAAGPGAPATTLRFVAVVDALQQAGLSVAETEGVLTGGDPPSDEELGGTLTELRAVLQGIARDTAAGPDERGDRTRKQLASLGWAAPLVEEAVATLLGTSTATAPLAALPGGLRFPADLAARVRFDETAGLLSFTGPMTIAQRDALTALSADGAYRAAVQALFDAPRLFVARRMKALVIPISAAPLAALPAGYTFPAGVAGVVFHDADRGELRSRGYLTGAQAEALRDSLPAGGVYGPAVDALLAEQEKPPAAGNELLDAAGASALFDADRPPADRFAVVLDRVLPFVRRRQSEAAVTQKVVQATGLDPATAADLVWRRLTGLDLLAGDFVASDPAVAVTRRSFPGQFTDLAAVHRAALVLLRLRLTGDQLSWVFEDAAGAGWLDLNAAPTGQPLFEPFLRLLAAVRLRDGIPGGARTLTQIWPATGPQLLDRLATLTGWDPADLTFLTTGATLPDDLRDERLLTRILNCLTLTKTLGVTAERAATWTVAEPDRAAADAAWSAAKAKHELQEWLPLAGDLRDGLRERQRAALVAYLVANPLRDAAGNALWLDSNGLYAYLLIDVEMAPCQLTSRIVQAHSSLQLFVQRCLLNIEPSVSVDAAEDDAWAEWRWRSRFREWEANQKVWLYPENYLVPEVRDNKTPFFVELENELRQKEITPDNVETALLHYLEKLDDVARLQPCGSYHELDTEGGETVERLHVVARTESTPYVYYYRTWENRTRWTPWEKIDLDIEGDTLMPVVWNRRPHLFWVTFLDKTVPPSIKMPQGDTPMPEPLKYQEIRLHWSQYRNGRWQPKRIAKDTLSTLIRQRIFVLDFTFVVPAAELILRPQLIGYSGELKVWVTWNSVQQPNPDVRFMAWGGFQLSPRAGAAIAEPISLRVNPTDAEVAERYVAPPKRTFTNNNEFVEKLGDTGLQTLYLPDPSHPASDAISYPAFHATPGAQPFRLLYPHQYTDTWTNLAMFFTDAARCYLLTPALPQGAMLRSVRTLVPGAAEDLHARFRPLVRAGASRALMPLPAVPTPAPVSSMSAAVRDDTTLTPVRFTPLYHPYVDVFVSQVNRFGPAGLYDRELQTFPQFYLPPDQDNNDFQYRYNPLPCIVAEPYPPEIVDFAPASSYGDYNWELFFHAPLLLATRLSAEQRFAEAQQWFHTIFDPTDRSSYAAPQRYWRTKPFFETSAAGYQQQRIESLLRHLADGTADTELRHAWEDWRDHPYQPHVVARARTTAYQKSVVMMYLDNLIAWGDQLYRQDTMESVNAAAQLYVLAAELLGRRPEEVDRGDTAPPQSYRELSASVEQLTEVLDDIELLLPDPGDDPVRAAAAAPMPTLAWSLYFCLPRNDKLLGYWDTVAERLFNIRHCRNIAGVERQLALFAPPIDPMLLIRAAAAGLDLDSALREVNTPVPLTRFVPTAAKATELTGELRSLGSALLSAMEKRDAEALAQLRSGHELSVLEAARDVRTGQVREATETLTAVDRSRDLAQHRYEYYSSRAFMNVGETAHTLLSAEATILQDASAALDMMVTIVRLMPELKLGVPTTFGASFGGSNLGDALRGFASSLGMLANARNAAGSLAATVGGYQRRAEDWQFQAQQATKDKAQLDRTYEAARIRLELAEREVENHDLQIANARDADAYLRDKFTNHELYEWMVAQLSAMYFAAYELAYDVAKRAEQAYRHELADPDATFVRFGHWDGLRQGLLAGERLHADLKRMEAAHLERNRRELELVKHISLAQVDPEALLRLRTTGECFVTLPEALYDLDCPGHYLRRIRTAGFTLACVAGSHADLHCTATLVRSSIRQEPRLFKGKYARQDNDPRFRDFTGSVQTVVTSTGQEQGLFDAVQRDDRYLPFEGSGAAGEWHLAIAKQYPQLELDSLTDVVITVQYTARDGGPSLAGAVTTELRDAVNAWVRHDGERGQLQCFSARTAFNPQWNAFLYPAAAADHVLRVPLSGDVFPYLFHGRRLTASKVHLLLVLRDAASPDTGRTYRDAYATGTPLPITGRTPGVGGQQATVTLASAAGSYDGTPNATVALTGSIERAAADWVFTVRAADVAALAPELRTDEGKLNPDAVTDLLLVVQYKVA
ncbi:Tc toxin subunit A-related protein [Paractinoplanes globisporus]|uniref:Neuraminidase-like domain-containing protein n=1 Tax=Paractinoplanes globisporus TaxID=113565 RepID=A0ABW6WUT5_9ACTN|nr:neuraminidase-like domain-containing protein [Actinoplanes globisporus]